MAPDEPWQPRADEPGPDEPSQGQHPAGGPPAPEAYPPRSPQAYPPPPQPPAYPPQPQPQPPAYPPQPRPQPPAYPPQPQPQPPAYPPQPQQGYPPQPQPPQPAYPPQPQQAQPPQSYPPQPQPAQPQPAPAVETDPAAGDARPSTMTRSDVYTQPMEAGRPVLHGPVARLRRWMRTRMSSDLQRREWAVDAQLLRTAPMSRPNTIAVISPKGGVGKTTISFVLGNLLASELHLRAIALDANPDFGTLAALTPDGYRSSRSLADLLADSDSMESPAELHPYVSRLPSGLHLLGAPAHAEVMAQMTPALYARLLDFLERFYEILILDLGTGITDPLAQFAVERAEQTVVITTPEWITSAGVLGALRYLQLKEGTLVLNQAPLSNSGGNREVIEENFRRQAVATRATIPYDQRLRSMLDTGTYDLNSLRLSTRVPVKELAVALTQNFV